MKRAIALCLALCFLLVMALPVHAEERPLRILIQGAEPFEDWLAENAPDLALENLYAGSPTETQELLRLLASDEGPDLLLIFAHECDLNQVLQSGLLEDLSDHEEICLGLEQMYQPFQDLVAGPQGEIYAVPYWAWGISMHAIPAAWEAAGLSTADMPQSFTELLDFAQRWVEMVQSGEVENIRLNTLPSSSDHRYTLWLMELLQISWIIEKQAAGEAIEFNDPTFVDLAQRAREAGQALAEAEKLPGQSSLSLYDQQLNSSQGYGNNELYANAFPLRLETEDPVRVRGFGALFVVRKDSPYAELCKEFLGDLAHRTDSGRRNVTLYQDLPQGQITSNQGEDGYVLTQTWLDSYRPEWVYFACDPFLGTDKTIQHEACILEFADGEISAQELAAALDDIVQTE